MAFQSDSRLRDILDLVGRHHLPTQKKALSVINAIQAQEEKENKDLLDFNQQDLSSVIAELRHKYGREGSKYFEIMFSMLNIYAEQCRMWGIENTFSEHLKDFETVNAHKKVNEFLTDEEFYTTLNEEFDARGKFILDCMYSGMETSPLPLMGVEMKIGDLDQHQKIFWITNNKNERVPYAVNDRLITEAWDSYHQIEENVWIERKGSVGFNRKSLLNADDLIVHARMRKDNLDNEKDLDEKAQRALIYSRKGRAKQQVKRLADLYPTKKITAKTIMLSGLLNYIKKDYRKLGMTLDEYMDSKYFENLKSKFLILNPDFRTNRSIFMTKKILLKDYRDYLES